MKTFLIFALGLFVVAGCGNNPTENVSNQNPLADGSLILSAVSSTSELSGTPLSEEPSEILLTISQISVKKADDTGWVTIAETEITIDFLQLVNGLMAELADVALEPGYYTQLRLVVAEMNEVIIDGESNPLVVPSGFETGVKLNLNFTIEENQATEIVVDFDITRSVIKTETNYLLQPTFSASLSE